MQASRMRARITFDLKSIQRRRNSTLYLSASPSCSGAVSLQVQTLKIKADRLGSHPNHRAVGP